MYPFLPDAKAQLEPGLNDADIDAAILFLKQPVTESTYENTGRHVKLYALSKALLSCLSDYVKKKYAKKKAEEYVQRINRKNEQLSVGRAFLESLHAEGERYSLTLSDYLRFGENLVHQTARDGRVAINNQELNALLSKAIAEKFTDSAAQDVPDAIQRKASALDDQPKKKSYGKKFLDLGCIQSILTGSPEGKRFYGAMGLSIAARRDGVPKDAAQKLMQDYVSRCSGTKPFTPSEGESTLNWVYDRDIGFSCKVMMDNGFEGTYCPACPLNWRKKT
ncbi:hypothetical protein HY572_00720 [Candidatus Micrarchaeota archaeon]|nr:hypothetical protein [Candidatus Micrarchaeota archaeon]